MGAPPERDPGGLVSASDLLLLERLRDPWAGRAGLGSARARAELDFELEVGAIVDTPSFDLSAERAAEAIGGYFVLNDWSARDLQRDESTVRLGPAKGKDFAMSIGPWIVTPDELADRWPAGANGAGSRDYGDGARR